MEFRRSTGPAFNFGIGGEAISAEQQACKLLVIKVMGIYGRETSIYIIHNPKTPKTPVPNPPPRASGGQGGVLD